MNRGIALRIWRSAWSAMGHVSPALEPRPGGSYDRILVDRLHRVGFGHPPNLKMPTTHVEKMAWQKLFHRNPLVPVCSDKVQVRDFVRHLGLGQLLIPGAEVYRSARDIDWDRLPQRFVLKPNHGSQWIVICDDQRTFDRKNASARLSRWMRRNYSLRYAETNYRGIKRRILMEPFLGTLGSEVQEHKFFCFHGEPRYIAAIVGRKREGRLRQFFDCDWQPLAMGSRGVLSQPIDVPRPNCYDEMEAAARLLSAPFMHVRVDFLVVGDRPYFGELTFYNYGGVLPMEPEHLEKEIGSLWDLDASDELCRKGADLVRKLG